MFIINNNQFNRYLKYSTINILKKFNLSIILKKIHKMTTITSTEEFEPLVICGPSGVGKGTIINLLLEKYQNYFGFSISNTSRAPRNGEIDGVHYYFSTSEDMLKGINNNEYIEHATVHNNLYGTTCNAVYNVQRQHKICILDIDIQGAQSVKKSNLKCKYLFITPKNIEVLEERLRKRNTETEEKIKIRLHNAINEIEFGTTNNNFDAVIINDVLEDTLKQVINKLQEWYPSLKF